MERIMRRNRQIEDDIKPFPELHSIASKCHVVDLRLERLLRRQRSLEQNGNDVKPNTDQLANSTIKIEVTGKAGVLSSISPESVLSKRKPSKRAIEWASLLDTSEPIDEANPDFIRERFSIPATLSYSNPIHGVLGVGRGDGLPEFEFRSIWNQYDLLPDPSSRNPTPWAADPGTPPANMKLSILSVVASLSLGSTLDLNDIALKGTNMHYNPDETFTPLVMRLKQPKATALVFTSGKMVVTGTQSEAECTIACRRFARIIQKLGYRVSVKGLQIQNISATCKLGFKVRVHLFAKDKSLGNQIGFYPELFTGVSIPLACPKVKVMIFRTGSVLITGAKCESELYEGLRIVYPFAKLYAN